ncbi:MULTISPECIES: bifunctional phosphopantothenoylcysteine decarboxylase/phosphopantothenate--cysteine ligase CoaBC [unclassified Sporolactobacillus]|uniref:bifunctional phosphopantothenoylcysteine decarboxylase/phosphopantothenate--cysteine ligase CoaBC n=1 Tax=unclassified Sporolactobacillus TaxID=2628533 RepID=UPI002368EF45|nr:bifunctional phosphopantothenoylcysteine decarboxylase/phosphopantothenate--cysteine ligase CoaBC [Sporolactobacillus sp. CQH2019]MDD9147111.1 bifunctional phosphopantothenoylcysteine decarboxylase/phosphopantothenate--cysteine ligase CoaBC [Sporolactobacillus sp. CQH2019]
MTLSGKKIVLGLTGGIAAYKAAELSSLLVKSGAIVDVVMTEAAKRFIGEATFQALTRRPVYESVFAEKREGQIAHIDLADTADLLLVAPATANMIGKLAAGLADDMLSTVILASKAPVWIAPAMNVNMYAHPAVQKNLRTLEEFGYRLIGPDQGRLACGWTGKGRLVEPKALFAEIEAYFAGTGPADLLPALNGKKILVTAGPTLEAIDPVRYFSNHSSGKMGYAVACAAKRAGAEVTLIAGPTQLEAPQDVPVIKVNSAREMYEAVVKRFETVDAVVKAAAVADYRPETVSQHKIKKGDGPLVVTLVRNPDILKEIGSRKTHQLLVGFAAETEDLETNARQKLEEKHLDLLVANRVEDGFRKDTNKVTFFFADGRRQALEQMSKQKVAEEICRALAGLLETSVLH